MSFDMSPSSVGRFIIATGAAAGWLMTGSVTQDAPEVRDAQPSVARPAEAEAMPPAQFTEVLRERMREPIVPERGRNPFTYGSRVAPAPERVETALPPDIAVVPATPPPVPVFKLSGIAASQQDGATILTAIVIDNGVMVLAKAGDTLSNGHSVLRVDEMSITLIDGAGVTQTLRLP
jgi:hypothetical protein